MLLSLSQASAQIAIDLNRTLPKLSFFTRGSAEHKMLADVHSSTRATGVTLWHYSPLGCALSELRRAEPNQAALRCALPSRAEPLDHTLSTVARCIVLCCTERGAALRWTTLRPLGAYRPWDRGRLRLWLTALR